MSTPSEPAEFSARYNDGRSAATIAAKIRSERRGLVVSIDDGGEIDCWAWADVRLDEPPAPGRPARLSNRSRPGLRLAVEDRGVVAALRAHARNLRREPLGRARILTFIGITAGCAAVVAFFIYGLPLAARPLAAIVPVAWEEPVGESTVTIVNQIFAGGRKLCGGTDGDAAIRDLARRLAASVTTPYEIRISVADSGIVNALAAPGGRIVIFRGLIDRAKSADEVAGVLAHEMAHVVHRHPTQGMIASIGWSALLSVFTGGASLSNDAVARLAAHLATSAYSRDLEAEADESAIAMLAAAGIGSQGLAEFFKAMEAQEAKGLRLPEYLSTHPQTSKRIEAAEDSVAKARGPALSAEDWRAVKAICR